MTIYILYKEGKADYLLLGSYRLIALKKHPQQDFTKSSNRLYSRYS
jgi:hypothetical protein